MYRDYKKIINDDGSVTAKAHPGGKTLFHVRDERDFDDVQEMLETAYNVGVQDGIKCQKKEIRNKLGL